MKTLNRILRIALASTLVLSQGAWFPALASGGKHQAVIAIGADELKSEYGAGGGGGGTTLTPSPSPCTNSAGVVSTRATCNTNPPVDTGPGSVTGWAYVDSWSDDSYRVSTDLAGRFEASGVALGVDKTYYGSCSYTWTINVTVSSAPSASGTYACDGSTKDYDIVLKLTVEPGKGVALYKATQGQNSYYRYEQVKKDRNGNIVERTGKFDRNQRYKQYDTWKTVGYNI